MWARAESVIFDSEKKTDNNHFWISNIVFLHKEKTL